MTHLFIPNDGSPPMLYESNRWWPNGCACFDSTIAAEGPWPIGDDGKPMDGVRYTITRMSIDVATKPYLEAAETG